MPSLRRWFWNLLNHGEAPPVDPDEVVEAGYVRLTTGPIVLVRLQDAGIPASSAETRQNVYHGPAMARIFCRTRDLEQAQRIIDEVTDLSDDQHA
jgi:hypothetical protein